MKTQIKKVGDTVVVCIDGKLNFETNIPLRDDLAKLVDSTAKTAQAAANTGDAAATKIIFNLDKLEFVGSSGISSFVQTLREFNLSVGQSAGTKPRYCNVKSEFRRIMKAFDEENAFEFYDNEDRARRSFDQNN